MTTSTTAAAEVVVGLPSPNGTLVGVLTPARPAADDRDAPHVRAAAVVCPGGWMGTATNRNRVFVRLARSLAAGGVTALRFDWHGVGESEGTTARYRLDEPFTDDAVAASIYLADHGWTELTLIGVCFGARTALSAAHLPAVRRLVLLSFPVPRIDGLSKASFYRDRHGPLGLLRAAFNPAVLTSIRDPNARRVYRKGARLLRQTVRAQLRPSSRTPTVVKPTHTSLTSEQLERQLTALSERGVAIHFVFGEHDLELEAFRRFADGRLRQLLDAEDGRITVHVVEGNVHGFDDLAVQERVISRVRELVAPAAVAQ